MKSFSPQMNTLFALVVGAIILVANVAFNPNGDSNFLLLVTLVFSGGYAFWATHRSVSMSVVAVGAVVGVLVMLYMVLLFPRLPNQVHRAAVVDGISALSILYRPLTIVWAFFVLLSMLLAVGARYIMRRRWVASGATVTGTAFLIGSMFVYVQANPPNRSHLPPSPLGVSAENLLLTLEHVPRVWKTSLFPEASNLSAASVWKDVAYGPHGVRNQLNIFRPGNIDEPVPVVIYIHGAWVAGDKDMEGYPETWVSALLASGFAVAPLNYRWPPSQVIGGNPDGALFPAQIQDVFSAVRFLRKNAAEYRLDPNRIVAMGHSAGGHLAALAGLASNVDDFHNDGWNLDVDHHVQAAVSLAGPTDLRISEDQVKFVAATLNYPSWEYLTDRGNPNNSAVNTLFGGHRRDHMDKVLRASPIAHVDSGDPPLLLIHGFRDLQVSVHQSEALYCLLQEAGVDSEFHAVPGAGHPLADHPGTSIPIVRFLQKHLQTNVTTP